MPGDCGIPCRKWHFAEDSDFNSFLKKWGDKVVDQHNFNSLTTAPRQYLRTFFYILTVLDEKFYDFCLGYLFAVGRIPASAERTE